MLEMELPGKKNIRRPKKKFIDEVKADMRTLAVTEKDVVNIRIHMISCGHA